MRPETQKQAEVHSFASCKNVWKNHSFEILSVTEIRTETGIKTEKRTTKSGKQIEKS